MGDAPWSQHYIEGTELKIGWINYLGDLTKRVKCKVSNPSGLVWAMGLNIHYLRLFKIFFSLRAQVARSAKQPRLVFQNMCVPMYESAFWGSCRYLTIWVYSRGKNSQFGAPRYEIPIKRTSRITSKTVPTNNKPCVGFPNRIHRYFGRRVVGGRNATPLRQRQV